MNIPEFTAEASLEKTREIYRTSGAYGKARIPNGFAIPQALWPVAHRSRGVFGGFWECAACVAVCTIFVGDVVECYDACKNSGACEVVAVAR